MTVSEVHGKRLLLIFVQNLSSKLELAADLRYWTIPTVLSSLNREFLLLSAKGGVLRDFTRLARAYRLTHSSRRGSYVRSLSPLTGSDIIKTVLLNIEIGRSLQSPRRSLSTPTGKGK